MAKRKAMVGWKLITSSRNVDYIVKLISPARARRVCHDGKYRAEYVKVVAIYKVEWRDGWTKRVKGQKLKRGVIHCSLYGPDTRYSPGKITRPDRFDSDHRVSCSNGIHFYRS